MTFIKGAIGAHTPHLEKARTSKRSTLPRPDESDPDWRDDAACRDSVDPELWFPVGNTGPALLQIEDAKAVCRRCDVVEACGEWAMASNQDFGVWGAMADNERRALKKRRARLRAKYGDGES